MSKREDKIFNCALYNRVDVIAALLALTVPLASVAALKCFSSVEQFAAARFGVNFTQDENIVLGKTRLGGKTFHVVEDRTSGTNITRTLLLASPNRAYCVVLETSPGAQLDVLAVQPDGFPHKLRSTDQAPPGLPVNEITYVFHSKKARYVTSHCRQLWYKGPTVHRRVVKCDEVGK